MKKRIGVYKVRTLYVIVRRSFSEIEVLDSFGFKRDAIVICKRLEREARKDKKNNDYYEIHKSKFVGRREVEKMDLHKKEPKKELYKIKY